MDITGRSTDEVDTVVWEDDYFLPDAVERFIARLSVTVLTEQFLFSLDAPRRCVILADADS